MRLLIVIGCLIALCHAHGYMSNPPPRAKTIPNHPYQYEPQSDGAMNAICKDNGLSGPITATYTEGQIIAVSVTITAYHSGWIELWLCPSSKCSSLSAFTHRAISNKPSITPGCLTAAPPSSTDQPCLSPANQRADLPTSGGTFSFTLPTGFTCAQCTLMWWWPTNNYGNEHFKSCHDVTILPRSEFNITVSE